MKLFELGYGSFKVAARTGLPRSTVRYWNRIAHTPWRLRLPDYTSWRPSAGAEAAYCYLFGLYLGDGCLAHHGNSSRLILYLDESYRRIIEGAVQAIHDVFPGIPVCENQRPGCIAVAASHPAWPHAFPQDGPGRKHDRPIELTDWQRDLCSKNPRSLIRGLIHSDGSRVINRFSTPLPSGRIGHYAYVRYFFPTTRPTSGGSSATTASCSGSAGRSRASRTSRSHVATRLRSSTSSSGQRPDADERTRTSTGVSPPGPKPGASPNSATSAGARPTMAHRSPPTFARGRSRVYACADGGCNCPTRVRALAAEPREGRGEDDEGADRLRAPRQRRPPDHRHARRLGAPPGRERRRDVAALGPALHRLRLPRHALEPRHPAGGGGAGGDPGDLRRDRRARLVRPRQGRARLARAARGSARAC